MFLFYRITRELNPGIDNFRNLEEEQFLLGAIGGLGGKNVPKKFKIRAQFFKIWIALSTDYSYYPADKYQLGKPITLASRSRFIQWIALSIL